MGIIAGQAARALGVSTKTLALWADKGKIRATRTSGGWRIYDPHEIKRIKRAMESAEMARRFA